MAAILKPNLSVVSFFKLFQSTFDLRICAALSAQFGLYLSPVFALHISALAVSFASRSCCPDLEPALWLFYKVENFAHLPIVHCSPILCCARQGKQKGI